MAKNKNIINPISSNQVVEVPLLKPDCANFCGDTLNDWLQWLADKHCEIDWRTVDTSCLDKFGAPCEKNLKTIIESLIDAVCVLNSETSNPCGGDCGCSGTLTGLTFYDRWGNADALNPAQAYISGNIIHLKGRITGGSLLTQMFVLSEDARPEYERRVPFAHTFNLPTVANAHPFMRIKPDGVVDIVWTGSSPASTLPGDVFLDGISFYK